MYVTNIQRFSLDDGPGIRTTVFLAGCNMRCLWCHNPENLKKVMRRRGVDDNGCEIELLNSRNISAHEIMETVLRDRRFYEKTGGGLTVSGGEPVCQLEGLKDLLKISRESGIGTAIETSLNYDYSDIEELFPYLDLVIADCKAVSEDVHIKCTGVSNKRILKNIKRLSDEHKRVWIRIPVVPGVNITPDEMRLIGDFLSDINVELIELLPYHKMGADKYRTWGMEYILDQATEPSESYMGMCYNILSGKCRNVIRQEDKNG